MRKIILTVFAVLAAAALLFGCQKAEADASGADQSGEPSASESAAQSSESEPEQSQSEKEKLLQPIAPPDENGRFAPIDTVEWYSNYEPLIWAELPEKTDGSDITPFMEDADSAAKLKEKYPKIDDWNIVFEKDFYKTGLGYDSEKQTFVTAYLPVRFVMLSTEQGDGFDIVFACSKHYIDTDYENDYTGGNGYIIPYEAVYVSTGTANKSKIEGIDFSEGQIYESPGMYLENIPYLIWLPKTSSVFIMEERLPSLIKFEGAAEPVKIKYVLAAKDWQKSSGDAGFTAPKSRKNDFLIVSSKGEEDNALWLYSAADGTARILEGLDSFYTISYGFVSDTCLEAYTSGDGTFRHYDFSEGADPTKCVWSISGNGGGLLGGKLTDATDYGSIADKNDPDRLVILYSEDESNMFWICSYTLEDGVQTNFCLDLPADGIVGSCSVRSGVAYFSYYPAPYTIENRINYAVDVRPDKDHKLAANAW